MIYEDMEYINKCLHEELPPVKTRWKRKRKGKSFYFMTKENYRRLNGEQIGNR